MESYDYYPDDAGRNHILDAKVLVDQAYIDHLERSHATLIASNDELIAEICILSRQKSELRSALTWLVMQFKDYIARRRVVNLDESFAEAEAALRGSE